MSTGHDARLKRRLVELQDELDVLKSEISDPSAPRESSYAKVDTGWLAAMASNSMGER